MKSDFLRDIEYLGITARLKRLSDSMSYNIKALYKSQNIDIEPSWHIVFLILKGKNKCTMTEIANAFNYSQPAVTKIISKMVQNGYLDIITDKNDNRKKQVQLSAKAKQCLPKFEMVWNSGKKAIMDMLEGNEVFFEALNKFEDQQYQNNFKDRANKHLENN